MPDIRPFRALRFDSSTVGDLAAVMAPPYDRIDAADHERLLARHPANIVRVDLPEERHGDEPDARYRRAARALAEWRSTAILHKDPHPSVYVYVQDRVGASGERESVMRGYLARLRLDVLAPGSGIQPGVDAPLGEMDDRYKVLRATGVNTGPVVAVYDDPSAAAADRLAALSGGAPVIDIVDEGTRHRVWSVAADGGGEVATTVASLIAPASTGPLVIQSGRAVYDTALRYRDERRMSRSCEEDPAFDYVLTLFLERADQSPETTALTGLVLNPHEW